MPTPSRGNVFLPGHGKPSDTTQLQRAKEDDVEYEKAADELWSNYLNLAGKRDKAMTTSWKDRMNGTIIFAGLYSATLTAFLVESYQRLQEDPSETSVTLLKQSVFLLSQISQQLAPNGSQVNIVLPEPIPVFTATRADQAINALWFSSLVLSISTVLAATIVQQWAEYRMQVFERLPKAVPCSRIRHFLHEGTIKWKFDHVVATIPGLIHVALWLFFVGLAIFLFSIDTIVASVASAVLLLTSLAYLGSTILPLLSPQSPYQTPFSNVLWWLLQIIRARYSTTSFSPNLFDGRTQMVMKVASGRGQRDAEALSWILESPMSDAELEHFIGSIPFSTSSVRGQRLWDRVGYTPAFRNYFINPSSPHLRPTLNKDNPVHPLGILAARIEHFLEGCFDPSVADGPRRQQRAQAGVCAVLSLTFTGATRHLHPYTFGVQWNSLIRSRRLTRTLKYLSGLNSVGALGSDLGADEVPVARWVCMSILSLGTLLASFRLEDAYRRVQQEFRVLNQGSWEELVGEVEAVWSALAPLKAKLWSLSLSDDPQQCSRIIALSEDFAAKCVVPADPDFPSPLNHRLWTMLTTRMQDRADSLIQHLPGAVIEDSSEVPEGNGYHLTHMMSPGLLAMSLKQWAQKLVEIARDPNASHGRRFQNCRSHMSLLDTFENAKRWLPMQHAILRDFHYHDHAMLYRLALLVTTVETLKPVTPEAKQIYKNTLNTIMDGFTSPDHSETTFENSYVMAQVLNLENTQQCLLQVLKSFALPASPSGMKKRETPSFLVDAIAELVTGLPPKEFRHSARDTISNLRSLGQGTPSVLDECLRRLEDYETFITAQGDALTTMGGHILHADDRGSRLLGASSEEHPRVRSLAVVAK